MATTPGQVFSILSETDFAPEVTGCIITPVDREYAEFHKERSQRLGESHTITSEKLKSVIPVRAYMQATQLHQIRADTNLPLGILIFLYGSVGPQTDLIRCVQTHLGQEAKGLKHLVPFYFLLGKDIINQMIKR